MNTKMENGIQMTFDLFSEEEIYQEQIFGVSDSLVKTSQSLEEDSDSMESVQVYFSQLQILLNTYQKKINPNTFSLKTLKTYIAIINKDYRHQHEQIHDQEGIASTICARDYKDPQRIAVPIKNANKQGYDLAGEGDSINLQRPTSDTRRGRVGDGVAQTLDTECAQGTPIVIGGLGEKTSNDGQQRFQQDRVYDSDEVATSLSAKLPGGANMYDVPPQDDIETIYYPKKDCYIAIRKLTPKECFRLQGWTDDYFEKAQFVNSDSQLYKQAGNGVTVNVIEEIGRRMK